MTGRKQLPKIAIEVKLFEVELKKLISLSLTKANYFNGFPSTSRLKLRLFENKVSETIGFGTIGAPKYTQELINLTFSAPSCQLRIVGTGGDHDGLILGSTDTWTLHKKKDHEAEKSSDTILLFQPFDISPRSWKLEIRDDDYPVVYVDQNIPQSSSWVRSDPVFVSCVLPAIIREVFEDILVDVPERKWVADWLVWADSIMPGKSPPLSEGRSQKEEWINDLLDTFCQRHRTLDKLVGALDHGEIG